MSPFYKQREQVETMENSKFSNNKDIFDTQDDAQLLDPPPIIWSRNKLVNLLTVIRNRSKNHGKKTS